MKTGNEMLPISEQKVSALLRVQGKKIRSKIQREPATYQAGIAALCGMNNATIEKITGLRPHQVSYRLTHTGASFGRKQYRNGDGPIAEYLLKKCRPVAEAEFIELMREKLGLAAP